MSYKIYHYKVIIQETMLDSFGHVNNAAYLTLYEQARWDLLHQNGFSVESIKASGKGPVLLGVNLQFLKELKPRDEIIIESQTLSYERKTGILLQKMLRGNEVCSTAEFTIGFFDIHLRKLIPPTDEWLRAIGG